jgi:TPP-dependent 2-oxoacid decarboxylase
MSEPPCCVWLVIAPDVATRPALPVATAARPAAQSFDPPELETLVRAVSEAVRPMVVAGRGCRAPATAAWLRAFAEALPAPVLVTPAARGALPDPHPLCHGLLRADAGIVRRADVVLALGVDDAELASANVAFTAPVVRVGRIAALLEEVAPRLRDRSRADWDVAELDRLRRARPAPVVAPALATLVTRVRDATPSGTAAVFPTALEPATMVWQSVQPGDVLVDEDVIAASAALALARPEGLVAVFGAMGREAQAELQRAGVDACLPEPGGVGSALERALARPGPRVVAVPVPG